MNEDLTNLINNGTITLQNQIKSETFDKLKSGYDKYYAETKFDDNEPLEIIRKKQQTIVDYCPEILEILDSANLASILKSYLGPNYKITGVYGVSSKPKIVNLNDKSHTTNDNIFLFHHDQTGKQIKCIIPLQKIGPDQNCMEYAIGSHRKTLMDKFVIKILNLFGFYKKWDQPILNHLINLMKNKKFPQYFGEKLIKKKYKIKKVTADLLSVYLFETSGYHRQSLGNSKTDLSLARETIFIDIMPDNYWFKNVKMKMSFKELSQENLNKISKYL